MQPCDGVHDPWCHVSLAGQTFEFAGGGEGLGKVWPTRLGVMCGPCCE